MSPEPLTKGPFLSDVRRANGSEPNVLSSPELRQTPREDFGRHLVRARQGNEPSQTARETHAKPCDRERSGDDCADERRSSLQDSVNAASGEPPATSGDQSSKEGDEKKDENVRDLSQTPSPSNHSVPAAPAGVSAPKVNVGTESNLGASANAAGTAPNAVDSKGAKWANFGLATDLPSEEGGSASFSEIANPGSPVARPDESLKTAVASTASSRSADSLLRDSIAPGGLETDSFASLAKEISLLSASDPNLSPFSLNSSLGLMTTASAGNSAAYEAGSTNPAALLSFYCDYEVTADANPKAFGAALAPHLSSMISHSIDQAQIRMNPPELGPIQIELLLNDHDASITLTAAHPLTLSAIEQTAPSLRALLLEQGFTINRLEVNEQPGLGEGADRSGFAGSQGSTDLSRNSDPSRNSNSPPRAPWESASESDRNRSNLLQVLDRPPANSRTNSLLDIFA